MSVGGAPPTWATPSGSLDDARHRAGSNSRADGLKVQAAISGSENVVGAILFGTYWFARIVNELSVHSRLASLRSTTTVETDHPLLSFQLPDARVTADRRTHQSTPPHTTRQGKTEASEQLRRLQRFHHAAVLAHQQRAQRQPQERGEQDEGCEEPHGIPVLVSRVPGDRGSQSRDRVRGR